MNFARWFVWGTCLLGVVTLSTVGCQQAPPSEKRAGDASTGDSVPDTPIQTSLTYYKDVQPLIQKHCQSCHFQGGIAPFPLTTYEEVKAQATAVEWSVTNRRMPPWMPDDQCLPLAHSRRLSEQEIKTFSDWVKGGTPAGDPKDGSPYQPKVDELAWTSAELSMKKPYTPPFTNGSDDYHCFLTDKATTKDEVLTGFQFVPGAKAIVHHVLIYSVDQKTAGQLSQQHKDGHWPCFTGQLLTRGGSKLLGVFVPGTDVVRFPENTGLPMGANEHIVLEFHYNRSSLSTIPADQSKVRLQFAKAPVKHKLEVNIMVQTRLNVPPGAKNHLASASLPIPTGVKVWGFMPHMHKYGTKVDIQYSKQGKDACLANVPRWDYNWQQTYFFKNPLELGQGDRLKLNCFYNNPTDKTLRWGDRTEDEMCVNFVFYSRP